MLLNRCTLILILLALTAHPSFARKKEKKDLTERGFINQLMSCLAHKDAYCYIDLWPDLDTLTKLAMQYSDQNSADYRDAYILQQQPVRMMHADSVFKASLKSAFDTLIAQGEEQGVHWDATILTRYEMIKQRETRNRLYEKLAPTRFVGYVFFVDAISRRSYGLKVGDILNISGSWWGGRISEVYEAASKEDWEDARYYARKHPKPADSTQATQEKVVTEEQQELNKKAPEVIAERKYYSGMFDAEIPVQLYVRALKGGCPAGVCSWEAIYKFGDQDDYILLTVTKTEDGKWQMVEVPPVGTMELELKNSVFTGSWSAGDGQTGYDVRLKETEASPKKIKRLDDIFTELKGKK